MSPRTFSFAVISVVGFGACLAGCPTTPGEIGDDLLKAAGSLNEQAAKGDEFIGPFRLGDHGQTGSCRYKVIGRSGQCPPLDSGTIVCTPCRANFTGESLCRPEGTQVSAHIVDDGGRNIQCTLLLESVSKNCEPCPDGATQVRDFPVLDPADVFAVDQRAPGRDEKFCRYKVVAVPRDEKKNCPVKKNDIVCVPCPGDNKCHIEGWKIVARVATGTPDEFCTVVLLSLSRNCEACGKKGIILKRTGT